MRGKACLCRRRGCTAVRERWQLACHDCWRELPWAGRARYVRARKAKLTRIAREIGRELLRQLGRKPSAPTPGPTVTPTPSAAYARNCALLGEHDEIEPAQ